MSLENPSPSEYCPEVSVLFLSYYQHRQLSKNTVKHVSWTAPSWKSQLGDLWLKGTSMQNLFESFL